MIKSSRHPAARAAATLAVLVGLCASGISGAVAGQKEGAPPAEAAAPPDPPGTRCARLTGAEGNRAPVIAAFEAVPPGPAPAGTTVQLRATASDPDGDALLYTYNVTGGRTEERDGATFWTLTEPGPYTASVEIDDRRGCVAFRTVFFQADPAAD